MPVIERLVIVQSERQAEAFERIRAHFDVAATLPPRLLVVRVAPGQEAALRGLAGVAAVGANAAELDVDPPLSEGERLFADGWVARGAKTGPRAGESLPWDALGFEPPGAPRR